MIHHHARSREGDAAFDLPRAERWRTLSVHGGTVLLTGLSGAGKSTLARALERELVSQTQPAYVLDGDVLRQGLSADLGFSAAARGEQLRRVAHMAQMFADAGVVAVVALIAPLAAGRNRMREVHHRADLPFVEVFVDTPLQECERRDVKGLYARARRGELRDFTGIDSPYEPPEQPELRVTFPQCDLHDAVRQVLDVLRRKQAGE
jgi:adenylyl-sulfate kinase